MNKAYEVKKIHVVVNENDIIEDVVFWDGVTSYHLKDSPLTMKPLLMQVMEIDEAIIHKSRKTKLTLPKCLNDGGFE